MTDATDRVLVTGAGGPAGVAVIRELQRLGHHTIGVDSSQDAVGLRLADHAGVVPMANDPGLAYALSVLAKQYNATALISTIPDEMVALQPLEVPHWFPSKEALKLCCDKWKFYCAAKSVVNVPPTAHMLRETIPGSWVVKPRFGHGSKGIEYADTILELGAAWERVSKPIVQQFVSGREATIDILIDYDGILLACVPRWRDETRGGISVRGETFHHKTLVRQVQQLVLALGLTGSANVQCFISGTTVTFIEVNPRFSGGLPLSLASGADLVGQHLRGIHGLPLETDKLKHKTGVKMFRHFSEVYENA